MNTALNAPPAAPEIGYVTKIQDYLLYLEGLPSAKIHDVIVNEKGERALISALEDTHVEALMLDRGRPKPGDSFSHGTKKFLLPNPTELFGRTINPLGVPIDGKPPFSQNGIPFSLDITAPGINEREMVTEQFYTGVALVDTLIPIGKGQRELVFGNPQSGKSAFILDAISNQKNTHVLCVYASIGKEEIDLKRFFGVLEQNAATSYTITVAASSTMSAPLIALTPQASLCISEYFRDQGKDVFLIFDDLATHAKYLREISLLSGRIPGRESYPADIFFQHSHLVERAGNFSEKKGGGSITLLPIIETDLENFTSFIPTNVMSMTDGHIFFNASIRARGSYPAIMPERSVTRVGHQTQTLLHKQLSDKIRSLLAQYQELERFSRFGSELTASTLTVIKHGLIVTELLRQEPNEYIDVKTQIFLLGLLFTPFFDNFTIDLVKTKKKKIIQILQNNPAFKDISLSDKSLLFDGFVEQLQKKMDVIKQNL